MLSSKNVHKLSPESKKEVSKRQAKERREKERREFDRLASLLPPDTPSEKTYHLQVALGYIYLRLFFKQFNVENTSNPIQTTRFLNDQSINGFLVAFTLNGSGSGKILYVSDSCYNYTGFESKLVVGRHIYDLISKDDHEFLSSQLCMKDKFTWSADTESYVHTRSSPVENTSAPNSPTLLKNLKSMSVRLHRKPPVGNISDSNKSFSPFHTGYYTTMSLTGRTYFHTIDTVRSEVFIGIMKSGEFRDVIHDGDIVIEKTGDDSSAVVDQNTIILETDSKFRYLKHACKANFNGDIQKTLSLYLDVHPSSHKTVVKMHEEVNRSGFSESVYPIKLKRQFLQKLGFSSKAEYFDLKMYSNDYVKPQMKAVKSDSIFLVFKLAIPKIGKRSTPVPPMVSASSQPLLKKPKLEYSEDLQPKSQPSSNLEKLLNKFDPERIRKSVSGISALVADSLPIHPSAKIVSSSINTSSPTSGLKQSVISTLQNLPKKPGLKPKDQLLTELKREENSQENTNFQLLTASKEIDAFPDIKSFSTGSSKTTSHSLNTLQLSRKKSIGPHGEVLIGETQLTLKNKKLPYMPRTPEYDESADFLYNPVFDDINGYLVPPTPPSEKIPIQMKPNLRDQEYIEPQVSKPPPNITQSSSAPNFIVSDDNKLIDYDTYKSLSKKNPIIRTIGDTFSESYGSLSTDWGSGKRAQPDKNFAKINPVYHEPEKEKSVGLNLKWRSAPGTVDCVVNTTIGFDTTECDEQTMLEDYNNQGDHNLHEWMMNREGSEIMVTERGPEVEKAESEKYDLPEHLRLAIGESISSFKLQDENTLGFELPENLDLNSEKLFMLENGNISPKYIEPPPNQYCEKIVRKNSENSNQSTISPTTSDNINEISGDFLDCGKANLNDLEPIIPKFHFNQ